MYCHLVNFLTVKHDSNLLANLEFDPLEVIKSRPLVPKSPNKTLGFHHIVVLYENDKAKMMEKFHLLYMKGAGDLISQLQFQILSRTDLIE